MPDNRTVIKLVLWLQKQNKMLGLGESNLTSVIIGLDLGMRLAFNYPELAKKLTSEMDSDEEFPKNSDEVLFEIVGAIS